MASATTTIFVFSGHFTNQSAAVQYTEPSWEEEPGSESSDAEYAEWENRNPICPLADELGIRIDHDYLETIVNYDRVGYLCEMIVSEQDKMHLKKQVPIDHNTLVLIFAEGMDQADAARLQSTSRLSFHGGFLAIL